MTTEERKDLLPLTGQPNTMTPRKRGPKPAMQRTDHGELGLRTKYHHDYFRAIGRKGGLSLRERRGPEYFVKLGRLGGETTNRLHGVEHYAKMGKLSSDLRKLGAMGARGARKVDH
jgi:uncharacterized protein